MSEEEKILKTIRYCANDYMKQEDGIQCFEWGDLWVLNEYIDKIKQENKQLKDIRETAINYIDQVIMYKSCAREIDKELNTLIGILRGGNNE